MAARGAGAAGEDSANRIFGFCLLLPAMQSYLMRSRQVFATSGIWKVRTS